MNVFAIPALENLPRVVERLGWVLVHSLWQFALVALLAAVAVRLLSRNSAAARYIVLSIAMLATVLAPVATWMLQPDSSPIGSLATEQEFFAPTLETIVNDTGLPDVDIDPPRGGAESPPLNSAIPSAEADGAPPAATANVPAESIGLASETLWSDRVRQFLQPWLSWIVAAWSVGVLLCSLRPLLGWYTLRRLRRSGVSPVSDEVQAALRRVAEQMGLRRTVRVLHSTLAQVPLVVGYLRPIILLPVSLATSIPAVQLEAILAHELAHVLRHDFLANLLQTLVETVFFYHPAIWWISSRMRAERENCCDDLVVAMLGNRVEYGRALLAIEERRGSGSVLAIGAADGSLLARVRRIAGIPADGGGGSPRRALSLALCGIVTVCALTVLSWNSAAEADPTTEDNPVAETPDEKSKPKRAEVAARDAEVQRLRGQGQAALDRGDYPAMTNTFKSLSQAKNAAYIDAVWHGHSLHLTGRWEEASHAFQRAIALADNRLKVLDELQGPEYEEDERDGNVRSRPVRDWEQERDRERERIQADWPRLVLLAGRVQLMQLDDANSAVRTLSRGLRFAPEAGSLDKLSKAATEALAKPPKRPHPLWFKLMTPMATQRELALAYEKLDNMEAAADCWARVHLCYLAYQVGLSRVDADRLADIVSRVPAGKRKPHHELVLQNPGTFRAPKPQTINYRERLAQDARNPLRVGAKLEGFQMTKLGPARPSLAQLPNGHWVMAYTGGDEFQSRIYLSSSVNGKNWEAPWEFAHNNVFPTRSPSLIVDDDGALWMLCTSKRLDLQQFSSGQYRLWLCSSRDGRTWSGLRPIKQSMHSSGQYQQTAHITRDRNGKFWVISAKEVASADSPARLGELQPLPLAAVDKKRFISDMHASFDDDNRCHLLFSANGIYHTSSRNMVDWSAAEKLDGQAGTSIDYPQALIDGNRIAAIYETGHGGWLRAGTIDGERVAWRDRVKIGLPLKGSLLARDGNKLLLVTGPVGNGAAPVVLTAPIAEVVNLARQIERVIENVADKVILFNNGSVITTDASTIYVRLTKDGEQPAERKDLKAGHRVRYELAASEVAWKVSLLPATDEKQAAADKPKLRIAGRVLDAETGKPISKFRMVPTSIYRDDAQDVTWQTQYMKEFTDGRYLYESERPWAKTKLRIEAEGYRPATTRAVKKGESVEMDVKLVREIFAGVVRLPSGKPAAKAQVALASWTNEIKVESSKLSYSGHGAKLRRIIETDEQGRFVMPSEVDPWVIVVAHKAGYAEVESTNQSLARKTPIGQGAADDKPEEDTAVIKLRPWGRVEGRVLMGDKPVVGAQYWVYQARADNVHVRAHMKVVTDADGRFVVEQLPPGRFGTCQRYADASDGKSSHALSGLLVRFEIPAGKTTTLELGGRREHALIGKLALPEGFPHKIDWSKVSLRVSLKAPRFRSRFGGKDESAQSLSKFLQTEEGKLYGRDKVTIAADGSFRIEGLPAAEYQLAVTAKGDAVLDPQKPEGNILQGAQQFSVPGVIPSDADPLVDLGTLKLTSLVPLKDAAADPADGAASGWGPANNGVRARVVPVLSSMRENAIDLDRRVTKFEKPGDVAFVVELKNISDKPIELLDLWHGDKNGKRTPHSDWLGQFVCAVDLFDGDGKLIEQPDIRVDDIALALDGAQVATLEPGKTHRLLIRPTRWMTALQPRIGAGGYRAAVRYQGLSARNAARIKEVQPDSGLLAAAALNVVSAPVAFEVKRESRAGDLVWGDAVKGLRAAVSFEPSKAAYAHGEKHALRLHFQNVGTKQLTLISKLSLPNASATIKTDKGKPVDLKASRLLGRRLNGVLTLKPQQIAVLDAGFLGLAVTPERARQFEARTPRRLVAPAGKYSIQLSSLFGNILRWERGKDKVFISDAWSGELTTGAAPLTIASEIIECDIVCR